MTKMIAQNQVELKVDPMNPTLEFQTRNSDSYGRLKRRESAAGRGHIIPTDLIS